MITTYLKIYGNKTEEKYEKWTSRMRCPFLDIEIKL